MTQRVADAVVPLIGGRAPSTRRSSAGRRQTYVARSADRFLVRAATGCLAVGGLLLSFGVTSLFL
ncbi:hypothetical protein [Naasia aerilata]|nr:hypothetical protein [Naasia aerilata]